LAFNTLVEEAKEKLGVQEYASNDKYDIIETNVHKLLKKYPYLFDLSGLLWRWDTDGYYKIADFATVMTDINSMFGARDAFSSQDSQAYKRCLQVWARHRAEKIIPEVESKAYLSLQHCVAFKNKIVNFLNNAEQDNGPEVFMTNAIPWRIGDNDKTPQIDTILEQWCPGKSKTLKDIIAYGLIGHNNLKLIFFYYGPKNTGKTQYVKLQQRFFSSRNTFSSNFAMLTDPAQRFELINLRGKLAVFCSEIDEKDFYRTSTLKQLSGMDSLRGELKGVQGGISFVFTGKAHIATNSLPQIKDVSDEAFMGRCAIVDFNQKFSPAAQSPVDSIADEEFENLANWCYNRLQEWYKAGKIAIDGLPDFDQRVKVFRNKSNPLIGFIDENVEFDEHTDPEFSMFTVPSWQLREEFNNWLVERGHIAWDDKRFGHAMKAQYADKYERVKQRSGTRTIWCYKGLQLKAKTTIVPNPNPTTDDNILQVVRGAIDSVLEADGTFGVEIIFEKCVAFDAEKVQRCLDHLLRVGDVYKVTRSRWSKRL